MDLLSVIWDSHFRATNRTRKDIIAEDPGDKGTRVDSITDAFREYEVSVAVSAVIDDS